LTLGLGLYGVLLAFGLYSTYVKEVHYLEWYCGALLAFGLYGTPGTGGALFALGLYDAPGT